MLARPDDGAALGVTTVEANEELGDAE